MDGEREEDHQVYLQINFSEQWLCPISASGIRLIWELGNAIFTPFLCVQQIKNSQNFSGFYMLFPLTQTSFYILIPFWIMSPFTQSRKSHNQDFTLFFFLKKVKTRHQFELERGRPQYSERRNVIFFMPFSNLKYSPVKATILFLVRKSQT